MFQWHGSVGDVKSENGRDKLRAKGQSESDSRAARQQRRHDNMTAWHGPAANLVREKGKWW